MSTLTRRTVLTGLAAVAAAPALAQSQGFEAAFAAAGALPRLRTLIIAEGGEIRAERGFRGHGLTAPTNIKSASKSIISALVGIAIGKGLLTGVDQPIAPLLAADLPENPDPRLATVTIGHLLSMQAGLGPTSGVGYGAWVATRNWVRSALAMPFVADPGTSWQYSTGSTHLLSAILTRVGGASTLQLARDWLGGVEGFAISAWSRDRQGIYLGGNEMAMTPRSLLAFGELYRRRGRAADGTVIVPESWVDASWMVHSRSARTGDAYGYGWFLRDIAAVPACYAWGFGGQMLYILPRRDLVVSITSDQAGNAPESGYLDDLHALVGTVVASV